jgi:AraC family transcriptional regulator
MTDPSATHPDRPLAMGGFYAARINRVVDHIDGHLAEPLDLKTLAAVAHFSPWHFHRVFHACTGETLADRVRRRRMEVAAQRLLRHPPLPASAIAFELGFSSAEVFARTFRAHFGMTATQWRHGGCSGWAENNRRELSKMSQAQSKKDQAPFESSIEDADHAAVGASPEPGGRSMDVELRTIPAGTLAYLRYTGPYGGRGIGLAWGRFAKWCSQHALPQPGHALIGIAQDNPEITPPKHCRYDCCVEVTAAMRAVGSVGIQRFAGGRYGCTRFSGTVADINDAWMRLYGDWLPSSGWQPDDQPAIEIYDAGVDVDEETGRFSCLLCVPIRPLII